MNRHIPFVPCPRAVGVFLLVCVAAFALAGPAGATWSIVVVNRKTGEVCVASATCIGGVSLKELVPVIVVGKGGAAAQSFVDGSGQNRIRIRNGLLADWTPDRILEQLEAQDGIHEFRQYGIVGFTGGPVSFSGTEAGEAKEEIVGEVGELVYAIQGNVLTGAAVVWKAEEALLTTEGDLGEKVMAAMEAARAFGGDGRCSCSAAMPDSCGAPPPDFDDTDKSSHTTFIALARLGDTDGTCGSGGCANGDYYLCLEAITGAGEVDPVIELQRRYELWREGMAGVPDHVLSRVRAGASQLVADGATETVVTVELRDLDDAPIDHGGQTVDVTWVGEGAPVALAGPVTDHGGGLHSFPISATTQSGSGRWRIEVTQAGETVRLVPDLRVEVDPLTELHAGLPRVQASGAQPVPFVLNLGAGASGSYYHLLGSASGTSPGTPFHGVTVPLNEDRLFELTVRSPGPPLFPGSTGTLDATGRAEAFAMLPSPALAPFVGGRLDFCAFIAGAPPGVTNVAGFEVVP